VFNGLRKPLSFFYAGNLIDQSLYRHFFAFAFDSFFFGPLSLMGNESS